MNAIRVVHPIPSYPSANTPVAHTRVSYPLITSYLSANTPGGPYTCVVLPIPSYPAHITSCPVAHHVVSRCTSRRIPSPITSFPRRRESSGLRLGRVCGPRTKGN